MRRLIAVGLVMAVLAAGCARQAPRGEVSVPEVTEPEVTKPGGEVPAAEAGASRPEVPTKPTPLGIGTITGNPVDWAQAFPPKEPRNLPPLTENACATNGTGLTVDLRAAEWAPHPLANEPFWTPSVVVVACNATETAMKAPRLTLRFHHGVGVGAELTDLAPGEAIGPIRLFGTRGVTATVGATWQEHGERWPSLMAEVLEGERLVAEMPVRRAPAGATGEALGGGAAYPASPTLGDLRTLSWSQVDLGEQGQFFLYAPDIIRTVQTDDYCGAMSGQINASADGWAVYRSVAGGAPAKVLDLGMRRFPGARGMTAETAEVLGITFLFFGDYGSCANPTWYEIAAFDAGSGTAYHPRMKGEDGKIRAATATGYELAPDGALTTKLYNNADGKWHIYAYRWDGPARTWVFESHKAQ
ncbi:MAG TPA: hypothetical protein VD973_11130 [Symbiobacteriaceae bacterium]|nr:hypothetical protein [Symbiobacteriaceae bacterium]